MAVVLALPRYAVFRNLYNLKSLRYRKDDMYLSFTGDSVLSPEAKFAIEPASSGNGQVHVRSAYNNKYLVRNSSEFFTASATKPQEDATQDTCTLLEPLSVYDGDTSKIRFRHVYSGNYACLYYSGSAANLYDACLHAVSPSPNSQLEDAYEVIDWETLVIFPTHNIAFKGSNGYYLGGVNTADLQFSVDDKYQENASFRVESVGDGSVQVFSKYFSMYWGVNSDNWICANITDQYAPGDFYAMFWPIKLDSNVIALRSISNNRFLRGLDGDKLKASEESITTECYITVDDLVISRSIYNSVYRLEDARIYDETPIFCGKGTATNGSDAVDTIEIPITYTEAKTSSWEDSVSLTLSVGTTFETGVPFIAEGKVSFDTSATGTHTWGGTTDESFETGVTYTATIPPRKIVTVTYIATKGTCDVPFSYTLDETYSDGSHNITVKYDGLFTGVNCYSFSYDVKETPI